LNELSSYERPCRERDRRETARLGSRFKAARVVRERLREGFLRLPAEAKSCLALRRVEADVRFEFGGGNLIPARRAFDNPIAIACLAERAPCLPFRICSISSRTKSPA